MRRSVLLMTFALWSGLPLLCLVGLVIMWFGEAQALVLPDATDVRIEQPSLVQQHIAYQGFNPARPEELHRTSVR